MSAADVTLGDSTSIRKQSELKLWGSVDPYKWKQSAVDWFRQSTLKSYTDEQVEHRLLSALPFFPDSDGRRDAQIINTDIGNGKYIHEFFIENKELPPPQASAQTAAGLGPVRDVVLVHGYAASLGLFIDNFDSLTSVPGIRLHAIDLLGFGFSSRPRFPKLPSETKEDVYKVEDWYIDAIEAWRKKRNIDRFVLVGHSFGGYLSCAYALKYNKKLTEASGASANMIDKLVLVSPVGVERSKFSLYQEAASAATAPPELGAEPEKNAEETTRTRQLFYWLWERNYSPFAIMRSAGPFKSKFISSWTTNRFKHYYTTDPTAFQNIHDYMYRIFNAKGSGEYGLTRVLVPGALAKLPLMDRCPQKFVDMKLPTLWMYGDKDWMNVEAGQEVVSEINSLSKLGSGEKLARFQMLPDAGHHVYLDNPGAFARSVFRFIGLK